MNILPRMSEAERLTRLEERYAHLHRHQTEQDKVIFELTEEVAALKKELAALRTLQGGAGASAGSDEPADERPPHY